MEARRDDRSLGQLLGDLSRQLSTLVRQEIDLARTETTARVTAVSRDAALIGAGAAIGYAGFLFLLAALAALLIQAGLDPWLSALLVGAVTLAIGGALAWRGREGLRTTSVVPERTIETLKDDAEWAKEQIK
jgi:Putative Actinobacterial Holin-X, holin superfamily III